MRTKILALGLVAILSTALVACSSSGGGHPSGPLGGSSQQNGQRLPGSASGPATSNAPPAPADPGESDSSTSTGGGSGSDSGTAAICKAFVDLADSGGLTGDPGAAAKLQSLEGDAPPEIAGDLRALAEIAQKVGAHPEGLSADDQTKVTNASAHLGNWVEQNCGTS